MPNFGMLTWILIGVGALLVLGLIVAIAARRGREQKEQEHKIRRRQTWRVVSVVLLLALIIIFAVANANTVRVDWVLTETQAPMVLVIAISGGIGFLVGALVASRRSE